MFDDLLATHIVDAGMLTLKDLNSKISRGGRWYRTIPGIGEGKAKRIELFLATLLAREVQPAKLIFRLDATPSLFAAPAPIRVRSDLVVLAESGALAHQDFVHSGSQIGSMVDARNDVEAVDAWVKAQAGSSVRATVYNREAHRFLLWLHYERGGKAFSQVQIGDAIAYLAFLQNIPERWISRSRAVPGGIGWAPFRGT